MASEPTVEVSSKLGTGCPLIFTENDWIRRLSRTFPTAQITTSIGEFVCRWDASPCNVFVHSSDRRGIDHLGELKGIPWPRLAPLVVAMTPTSEVINALARLPFECFVNLADVDLELKRVVNATIGAAPRNQVARALKALSRSREAIELIDALFGWRASEEMLSCDAVFASRCGCSVTRLRYCCRKEFGMSLFEVRRWARLLLATELRSQGATEYEVMSRTNCDKAQLDRDRKRLVRARNGSTGGASPARVADALLSALEAHEKGESQRRQRSYR